MPAVNGESIIQELGESEAVISAFGLPLPKFIPRRYKPRNVGSWSGHLAFASDLIVGMNPELIVELGTHWGEAYFTFCQVVQENGLSSRCYAVDHWLGDEHAGHYGEEVFEDVRQYNERYYQQFSYLLRASFDEAVSQFGDSSIDLLHIDGLHTYEAVSHDFRTWLPKVKPGGIIMLHDICPKHQDFGVWRLWDEIKTEFRSTFEFHHSWGLGVVRKEGKGHSSPLTEYLFDSCDSVREEIRRRYIVYASHLENVLGHSPVLQAQELSAQTSQEIRVQVFPFGPSGYSEETSLLKKIQAGTWSTLVFELPEGVGKGPLRIDPGHEPSLIEVGDISIHSNFSGDLLWCAPASFGPDSLIPAGTAAMLPSENGSLLISSGDDPQFVLAVPPSIEGAVKLTVTLRVSLTPTPAPDIVDTMVKAAQRSAEQQVAAARLESEKIVDELRQVIEQNNLERDKIVKDLTSRVNELAQELVQNDVERDRIADELSNTRAEKERTEELLLVSESRLRQEKATRLGMQESLSWRVTEPVRRFMTVLRSGPRKPTL